MWQYMIGYLCKTFYTDSASKLNSYFISVNWINKITITIYVCFVRNKEIRIEIT